MPWTSEHGKWFINTGELLNTTDGKKVEVWEFQHQEDEDVLSAWAKHFRNHYCLDKQIDILRDGTGLTRKEYLKQIKFPSSSVAPGPSIRAGDFAEILAADFLEFILKHWVPRTRYANKTVRNESEKGADTIGFYFSKEGKSSPKDKLTIIESKAKYSGKKHIGKLQDAIAHSAKDVFRKAESLNAIKQRFFDQGNFDDVKRVARFQNEVDNPYLQSFGAIAHLDNENYDSSVVTNADSTNHPFKKDLFLIVIKGNQMMSLVHALYRRAADEA
jgi:hypothetical protein